MLWLKRGDSNSKFFHASASSRKKANTIESLHDDHGVPVQSQEGLCNLANEYFSKLFAGQVSDMDYVVDQVLGKLSAEDNVGLLAPFTDEESKKAAIEMHPEKSPGPMGLMLCFIINSGILVVLM